MTDTHSTPSENRDETSRMEAIGERIALMAAQGDAFQYDFLAHIRRFDQGEGWADQGCRSCAHWLNWRIGLDLGAARQKVRTARALGSLALISEAMRKGQISYSKVRALTRIATPENEEDLLHFARSSTAHHVERLVRGWRLVDREAEEREERIRHECRHLYTYTDEDGMVVLRGRLEPEAGAALLRALEAAGDVLHEETRELQDSDFTPGQRRADALALVAESALEGGLDNGTRGDRYQVVVHVDAEVLADPEEPGISVLEDGQRVSPETSRRLACDAGKVVMTHDEEGSTVNVGRRTRTVPPALRRALTHRDRGCQFPGCGVKYCDAHHIDH